MPTVQELPGFSRWLSRLRDEKGRGRIAIRIDRLAQTGHMGVAEPVGEGVSEMKIDTGPGYRVYVFQKVTGEIFVLLCGGNKKSQAKDIVRAKTLANTLR